MKCSEGKKCQQNWPDSFKTILKFLCICYLVTEVFFFKCVNRTVPLYDSHLYHLSRQFWAGLLFDPSGSILTSHSISLRMATFSSLREGLKKQNLSFKVTSWSLTRSWSPGHRFWEAIYNFSQGFWEKRAYFHLKAGTRNAKFSPQGLSDFVLSLRESWKWVVTVTRKKWLFCLEGSLDRNLERYSQF